MQLVSFDKAELFDKGNTKVYEYNIDDKDINFCIADINGRFPAEGYALNEKVKEMAYIIKGKGAVEIEGKSYPLKKGDCVLINIGEKFFWTGKFSMAIPCSPAWYPEQHKTIK